MKKYNETLSPELQLGLEEWIARALHEATPMNDDTCQRLSQRLLLKVVKTLRPDMIHCHKGKTIQIVMQQGGSSSEFYASSYNTVKQAERAIESHEKASYNAAGPFELAIAVPMGNTGLVRETDVLALLGEICGDTHGM